MSLLKTLIVLLAASSACSAAGAADQSSFDEATSSCDQQPPLRRTLSERVGGKLVQQEVALRLTAVHGCVWTLPGGNRTSYTLARRCLQVSATVVSEEDGAGGSWRSRAVAPVVADPSDPRLYGKCRLRRSVDCRLHSAAFWDPRLPCPEAAARLCPQPPRLHWRQLGGRNVSQTLVSLTVVEPPTGDGVPCEWVLLGGWSGDFTRWAGSAELPCARCRGGLGGCAAPTSPPSTTRLGCISRLGPDCRFHDSAIDDPEAACPPPMAAAAAAAAAASSVVGEGVDGSSRASAVVATAALLTVGLAAVAAASELSWN